ncbi:MAG: ribonuclease E activity regulator RraA [Steroidobacter sp.]
MSPLTADLVDAHGDVLRGCEAQFRSYGGRACFNGPVRTLQVYEDNALVKQTLSSPGGGAVLVIDGGASMRCCLLGDYLAALGKTNGWAGIIVWGAVRDTVQLGLVDIGVKALGSNPLRPRKTGAGQLDVPIEFGGAVFRPGDWVYSDADGLVVSDRSLTSA